MTETVTKTFCYHEKDLQHARFHQWGEPKAHLSKFDKELQRRWNLAMAAGHFRYNLEHLESRIVPGKYRIVAQLNEKRFTQRRKAEVITKLQQPFDPDRFNFTKVPSKEILMRICPEWSNSADRHLLFINVSPVEFGSSLLVPFIQSCLPQILTLESIRLAMEVSLLSTHRGFHVGFNSLCAFASVNHLHFHAWYMEYPSCLETVTVAPVTEDLFETKDFPTNALVFEFRGSDALQVSKVAKKIHAVASYFLNNGVAHNMHILRGDPCSPTEKIKGGHGETPSVLRVFLWPRKPAIGSKDEGVWDRPMAVCEMSGQMMMDSRESLDHYTEDMFRRDLEKASLISEEFELHKLEIRKMLSGHLQ